MRRQSNPTGTSPIIQQPASLVTQETQATAATAQQPRKSGKFHARAKRMEQMLSRMSGNRAVKNPNTTNLQSEAQHQRVESALSQQPHMDQQLQPQNNQNLRLPVPSQSENFTRALTYPQIIPQEHVKHVQQHLVQVQQFEHIQLESEMQMPRCSPGRHRTGTQPLERVNLRQSAIPHDEENESLAQEQPQNLTSSLCSSPFTEKISPAMAIENDSFDGQVSPDPVDKLEMKDSLVLRHIPSGEKIEETKDLLQVNGGEKSRLFKSMLEQRSLNTGLFRTNTLENKTEQRSSEKGQSRPPRPASSKQSPSIISSICVTAQTSMQCEDHAAIIPETSTIEFSAHAPLLTRNDTGTEQNPAIRTDNIQQMQEDPEYQLKCMAQFTRAQKYHLNANQHDGTDCGQFGEQADKVMTTNLEKARQVGHDNFFDSEPSCSPGNAGRSSIKSPAFNNSAQQQTHHQHISNIQQLKASLNEDQTCTIQQGEHSYVIDANLLRLLIKPVPEEGLIDEGVIEDNSIGQDEPVVSIIQTETIEPLMSNRSRNLLIDTMTPRCSDIPPKNQIDDKKYIQPSILLAKPQIFKPEELTQGPDYMSFIDQDVALGVNILNIVPSAEPLRDINIDSGFQSSADSTQQYNLNDETQPHNSIIVPENLPHDIKIEENSSTQNKLIGCSPILKLFKTRSQRRSVKFAATDLKAHKKADPETIDADEVSNFRSTENEQVKPQLLTPVPVIAQVNSDDKDSSILSASMTPLQAFKSGKESSELQNIMPRTDQLSCIQPFSQNEEVDGQGIQKQPQSVEQEDDNQEDVDSSFERMMAEMNEQIDKDVKPPPPPPSQQPDLFADLIDPQAREKYQMKQVEQEEKEVKQSETEDVAPVQQVVNKPKFYVGLTLNDKILNSSSDDIQPAMEPGVDQDNTKTDNLFGHIPVHTPPKSVRGRFLFPINEEHSHYDMADTSQLDESVSASYAYSTYHPKFGSLGKPSDFNKGDLRQYDLRLNQLKPFSHQNSGFYDQPPSMKSGNPLIDQLSMYAYGHGIQPEIFSQRDKDQAQDHIIHLMNELTPPTQSNSQRGASLIQAQQFVQDSLKSEIEDIRTHLHDPHKSDPSFYEDNQFQAMQVPLRRRLSAGAFHKNGGGKSHGRSNSNGTEGANSYSNNINGNGGIQDGMIKMLRDETVKNKTKIVVLTIALNRYLNNQDRQKVHIINRQIRILEQHERKVQEIVDMFKVFKKELHFAFLFASPLVLQKQDNLYRFFPQLNHMKEFHKIRDSINAAQVQVNITKRQCTTDSLQEVLAQKPLGLHFSGHGLENNEKIGAEFHQKYKGQGDFLVLENDSGGSELVSRDQLKKMIRQNKVELEFVFVATCHSEEVGTIFQQAGAKHVICIKKQNEVKDEAAIAFTNMFYNLLFQQNKEICTAFHQAQLSVEISMGSEEANIFRLLLREDLADEVTTRQSAGKHTLNNFVDHPQPLDKTMQSSGPIRTTNGKLHFCKPFGPFQKGRYNYVNHQTVHLLNRAPKMPSLRGRQKDMSRLMDKLLNSKSSRLFNLIGWPGTGKSALVASMLDYISERGLLKGGSIYFNARNISMCEVFVRNFNQVLISENPTLFGIAKEREKVKHEPIKTLESILAKISIIDGEIVLVIDNAEQLIINERNDFAMLVSMMLTRVSQLKILLTSQRPLQTTDEFNEERIILNNLSKPQSANLFKEVMARDLDQYEINALLHTKPDFNKNPDEKSNWPYKKLHDHHLFTLLNGIPQSIILVASVLADPQKKLTLKQVYRMLTDDQYSKLLEEENIKDKEKISLRLSAQISFQAIEDDPECVDLLALLSLLPGGINPVDLDYLWSKTIQTRMRHIDSNRHSDHSLQNSARSKQHFKQVGPAQASLLAVKQTSSAWRRALAELKKKNLAEECRARKRSYNARGQVGVQKTKTQQSEQLEIDEETETDDIVIILPEIVRNFSEVKITEDEDEFFLQILSQWYERQLHEIYVRNENIALTAHRASKQNEQVARDFERLEDNLNLYVLRMHEKKLEERHAGVGIHREKRRQKLLEETSDSESLSSEDECTSMAEDLFSKTSSGVKLPVTGSFDTFRQGPVARLAAPQVDNFKMTGSQRNLYSNYPELREAYLNINKQRPALERYIEAMKPAVQSQHPRTLANREDKAFAYWRWAFEQVKSNQKSQEKDEQRKQFQQMAHVEKIGGENVDESFDSDQSTDFHSKMQKLSEEATKVDLKRIGTRRKLVELLATPQKSFIPMNFQRGSIKQIRPSQNQHAFVRQVSRMSVVSLRRNTLIQSNKGEELAIEERAMMYHLINLVLLKQFNVANSLIKRHFIHMKKCGSLFRANMRRLQALSLFRMYEAESQKKARNSLTHNELYSRLQKIWRCLKRAKKNFRRSKDSAWGLGLTFYQRGIALLFISDQAFYQQQQRGNDDLEQSDETPLLRQNLTRLKSQESCFASLNCQGLVELAKTQFEKASAEFIKVNHWRGLFNVYRHLEQVCDIDFDTQSSMKAESIVSPHTRNSEDARERLCNSKNYKKYLDFYEVQRYSESINTNLTIQRAGGDDLSLLSEIVLSSKHTCLFQSPEKVVPQDADSFVTDDDLTSVHEGDSEYESGFQHPKVPDIQVIDPQGNEYNEYDISSYEDVHLGIQFDTDQNHVSAAPQDFHTTRPPQVSRLESLVRVRNEDQQIGAESAGLRRETIISPHSNFSDASIVQASLLRPTGNLAGAAGNGRRGNISVKKTRGGAER